MHLEIGCLSIAKIHAGYFMITQRINDFFQKLVAKLAESLMGSMTVYRKNGELGTEIAIVMPKTKGVGVFMDMARTSAAAAH